jgi:hypothetical protein
LKSSNGGSINFSPVAGSGKITLLLEKGSGAAFLPYQPVTLEIARTPAPGIIRRNNSTFTFDPNEWNLVTSNFAILPGSFTLFTTESGSVLNVQFTPIPEPASILGLAAAGFLLSLGTRRFRSTGVTA